MSEAIGTRWMRRLAKSGLGFVLVWLLLMLAGRVVVRQDRRTSERIFEELTAVRVGEGASAALDGLRSRWPGQVEAYPSCSATLCDYQVSVYFLAGRSPLRKLLVEAANGHEIWAMLRMTVRGGVVTRLDYTLATGVTRGYGRGWERCAAESLGYLS